VEAGPSEAPGLWLDLVTVWGEGVAPFWRQSGETAADAGAGKGADRGTDTGAVAAVFLETVEKFFIDF
jgi:hypothetical protein